MAKKEACWRLWPVATRKSSRGIRDPVQAMEAYEELFVELAD
jgi:hypothetical protein